LPFLEKFSFESLTQKYFPGFAVDGNYPAVFEFGSGISGTDDGRESPALGKQ